MWLDFRGLTSAAMACPALAEFVAIEPSDKPGTGFDFLCDDVIVN